VLAAGGSQLPPDAEVEGGAWIGRDVRIGAGVRLMGPVVLGRGSIVGAGSQLRSSIVLPGTELQAGTIAIDAILGHHGILQSLRP
jgi:mannose-1-phosphate guanylyltransferase/mannose-1-phosphate guanylyltransferase/phosphomannomutase